MIAPCLYQGHPAEASPIEQPSDKQNQARSIPESKPAGSLEKTTVQGSKNSFFFARVPPIETHEQLLELFREFGEVEDLNLFRPFAEAKTSKVKTKHYLCDHVGIKQRLNANEHNALGASTFAVLLQHCTHQLSLLLHMSHNNPRIYDVYFEFLTATRGAERYLIQQRICPVPVGNMLPQWHCLEAVLQCDMHAATQSNACPASAKAAASTVAAQEHVVHEDTLGSFEHALHHGTVGSFDSIGSLIGDSSWCTHLQWWRK